MEKIGREDLLAYVREELICTIGSSDAPVTIPVLITTFREDTADDIRQLAEKLGFSSIPAMLDSKEFCDIIEPCFTNLAKGAGNDNPEEVYCYRLKPRQDIAHILTPIFNHDRKQQFNKPKKNLIIYDPKFQPKIIFGKMLLLECLRELGAEEYEVNLVELQRQYFGKRGVNLDKSELKKHFPTGRLKDIMDNYLYDDVTIFTDANRNGSLLFKMKRPYDEIIDECLKIYSQIEDLDGKTKQKQKLKTQPKKVKKEIKLQQPRKMKVIKPPPEPKPKPEILLKPLVTRPNLFYTDDMRLASKIYLAHNLNNDCDYEANRLNELNGIEQENHFYEDNIEVGQNLMQEQHENIYLKPKYTTTIVGAELTESETEDCLDEKERNLNFKLLTMDSDDIDFESTQSSSTKNSETRKHVIEEIETSKNKFELSKTEMRILRARKKREQAKSYEEQLLQRNHVTGAIEGIFVETQRHGRRAKREEERRNRMGCILEKIKLLKNKPILKVEKKSQEKKFIISGLLTQFVWANHELGLSELKNMLRLLCAEKYSDADLDVEQFVLKFMKCTKLVRGPTEPHVIVAQGCAKDVSNSIINQIGKCIQQNTKKNYFFYRQ